MMHWALARTGHLLRALQRKYVTPSITADAHPTLLQNDAQRRVNRTRRYRLRTLVVTATGLTITFRPLCEADLAMLHDWIHRPHVAQWWGGGDAGANLENTTKKYLPRLQTVSSIKTYIALSSGDPIGFVQSYVALGCGDGWWEDETDQGVRGIDQFLCDGGKLGQGNGSRMVAAFVRHLFRDPAVTKVQTDPDPTNAQAIRCYEKAGFHA